MENMWTYEITLSLVTSTLHNKKSVT